MFHTALIRVKLFILVFSEYKTVVQKQR